LQKIVEKAEKKSWWWLWFAISFHESKENFITRCRTCP